MILPRIETEDELTALRRDPAQAGAILRAAAADAGLDPSTARLFDQGSAIVGRCADRVVKVFAPFDDEYARTEARVLGFLDGRLPLAIPSFESSGVIDGWTYLVMSRLEGEPLSVAWPRVPDLGKRALCRALGASVAALHALDPSPLAGLPPPWASFIEEQRAGARERQRALGLGDPWLDQIEPYLGTVEVPEHPPVLLHTEVMREHVFVTEQGGEWRLSGLLDFEPAMLGHPDYELASIGLFVTRGDRRSFRAFLEGMDRGHEIGPELPRRALAFALLHRYSHLPWYLRELGAGGATTLDELAARWWAL